MLEKVLDYLADQYIWYQNKSKFQRKGYSYIHFKQLRTLQKFMKALQEHSLTL